MVYFWIATSVASCWVKPSRMPHPRLKPRHRPKQVVEGEVRCTLGDGGAGVHPVDVVAGAQGRADGALDFEYVLALDSVEPAEGSLAGGTVLPPPGTHSD